MSYERASSNSGIRNDICNLIFWHFQCEVLLTIPGSVINCLMNENFQEHVAPNEIKRNIHETNV